MKRAIVVLICMFAVLFMFTNQLIAQEVPPKKLALVIEEAYSDLQSNLTDDGFGYFYVADEKTKAGVCKIHLVTNEAEEIFSMVTTLPTFIPEEKLDYISRFIANANIYSNVGHLGIDFENQIYFRTITILKHGKLTTGTVEHIVGTSLVTAEELFKYINKLIYSDIPYTEAVEKFENFVKDYNQAKSQVQE